MAYLIYMLRHVFPANLSNYPEAFHLEPRSFISESSILVSYLRKKKSYKAKLSDDIPVMICMEKMVSIILCHLLLHSNSIPAISKEIHMT